ncbi:uncharacterized protein LOC111781628 [Cucurbita pepo subsp. pepo]|uniref:uncharacterized protein LOC111781628 n=1 Tax=Cucurbita pepo subsp. pepo TaxID=3664 RepID=UPI000C9D2F8D|nr:uncharacterized protein LOC111781628 [Cucurbita pepo subsp. pepo]
MATKKRKSTIVEILSTQGISLVNKDEIVSEFVSFYTSLYTKDNALCEFPHDLDWSPIDQQQAASLEVAFTEEEVVKAIQNLGSDKTLGPDGFTSEFFQKCWNFMRVDIMRVFHDFFRNGVINGNLNETYIYLISKKLDARTVADFRPISLTTGLYKIIARVLSERLKKVLPFTITRQQIAFVEGRQILDATLMANELIDEWERKKQKGVVIKLDMEKAFDKVDWTQNGEGGLKDASHPQISPSSSMEDREGKFMPHGA